MIIIFYIFITFCQYECLGQPKSRRKVWILILPRHPSLSASHIRSCARGSFRAIRKSRASSDLLEQNLPPKSPKYIGYIILHHHHILDGWAQLHEAVKTGRPIEKRSYGEEFEVSLISKLQILITLKKVLFETPFRNSYISYTYVTYILRINFCYVFSLTNTFCSVIKY